MVGVIYTVMMIWYGSCLTVLAASGESGQRMDGDCASLGGQDGRG